MKVLIKDPEVASRIWAIECEPHACNVAQLFQEFLRLRVRTMGRVRACQLKLLYRQTDITDGGRLESMVVQYCSPECPSLALVATWNMDSTTCPEELQHSTQMCLKCSRVREVANRETTLLPGLVSVRRSGSDVMVVQPDQLHQSSIDSSSANVPSSSAAGGPTTPVPKRKKASKKDKKMLDEEPPSASWTPSDPMMMGKMSPRSSGMKTPLASGRTTATTGESSTRKSVPPSGSGVSPSSFVGLDNNMVPSVLLSDLEKLIATAYRSTSVVHQLERLAALRGKNELSEEEYAVAKQIVLSSSKGVRPSVCLQSN